MPSPTEPSDAPIVRSFDWYHGTLSFTQKQAETMARGLAAWAPQPDPPAPCALNHLEDAPFRVQPCVWRPDRNTSVLCGRVTEHQAWIVATPGTNSWVCELHMYPAMSLFIEGGVTFVVYPYLTTASARRP